MNSHAVEFEVLNDGNTYSEWMCVYKARTGTPLVGICIKRGVANWNVHGRNIRRIPQFEGWKKGTKFVFTVVQDNASNGSATLHVALLAADGTVNTEVVRICAL